MKVEAGIRVPFNVNVLKKVISKELNGYIFTRGGNIVTQIISEGGEIVRHWGSTCVSC